MIVDLLLTDRHCTIECIKVTGCVIYPLPTILHLALRIIVDRLILVRYLYKSCLHCAIVSIKIIPSTLDLLLTILHLTIVTIVNGLIFTIIFEILETALHLTFIIKQVPITINVLLTSCHCTIIGIKIIFIILNILPTVLHLTVFWTVVNSLILVF